MDRFPLIFLICIGLVFLSYSAVGLNTYMVVEDSMLPSLKEGDLVVVERFFWRLKKPKHNQLLIFSTDGKRVIKRVAFVGDQYIPITSNYGVCVGENYIPLNPSLNWPIKNDILHIPKNQYFVLGDNLARSHDSRHYGLISKKNVAGSVLGILYSS